MEAETTGASTQTPGRASHGMGARLANVSLQLKGRGLEISWWTLVNVHRGAAFPGSCGSLFGKGI